MGCWDSTCMISNLPIVAGEKIKLVILQPNYGRRDSGEGNILGMSGYVYATDIMGPAFLPISGKYNDYGMIENIVEDWNTKIIFDHLKKKYPVIEVDGRIIEDWDLEDFLGGIERCSLNYLKREEKQPSGIVLEAEELLEQDERDLAEEDRAYYVGCPKGLKSTHEVANWILHYAPMQYRRIKTETKESIKLSFVMIRQDVWDQCTKLYFKQKGFFNPRSDRGKLGGAYYISGTAWAKYHFDKFLEQSKEIAEAKTESKYRFVHRDWNSPVFTKNGGEGRGLFTSSEYINFTEENYINKKLTKDIKKQWSELCMIIYFLDTIRIGWMVQPGQGSQTQEWEMHKKLAQIRIDICDAKSNEDYEL